LTNERSAALEAMKHAVAQWRADGKGAEFAGAWRAGLAAGSFSERAKEVSEGILTRVESAQVFGGESCSFSSEELALAFEALLEKLQTAK
jgi:hypothetical protein